MKKPLILLLLAVVLALAAWGGWRYAHRDADGALVLYGNVDIRQISLAFDGSGRIAELRAEGRVVIELLPGESRCEGPVCDQKLVEQDGQWIIQAINRD